MLSTSFKHFRLKVLFYKVRSNESHITIAFIIYTLSRETYFYEGLIERLKNIDKSNRRGRSQEVRLKTYIKSPFRAKSPIRLGIAARLTIGIPNVSAFWKPHDILMATIGLSSRLHWFYSSFSFFFASALDGQRYCFASALCLFTLNGKWSSEFQSFFLWFRSVWFVWGYLIKVQNKFRSASEARVRMWVFRWNGLLPVTGRQYLPVFYWLSWRKHNEFCRSEFK